MSIATADKKPLVLLGVILVLGFFLSFNSRFMGIEIALVLATASTIRLALVYLLNVYYLFPKFYLNQRSYIALSLLSIILVTAAYFFLEINYLPFPKKMTSKPHILGFYLTRLFLINMVAYFSGTFFMLFQRNRNLEQREKQLTQEKLETELKLLKAQINPHFIFNALNNIYSLTYTKSKLAPESVLKLSEMLRYVFYDCSKDKVNLISEIKYIENFSEFQKMKSEHQQNIKFNINTSSNLIEIAPMLLIPFIENAFKYSRIEEDRDAFVEISITQLNSTLKVSIINSIAEVKVASGSHMGMKNVRNRLDIIYRQGYKLTHDDKDGKYSVDLSIDLN